MHPRLWLLICLYFPQLVPPSVTIYSAAAGRTTLVFLTVMIGIIGPGTVAYGMYAHWVFRSTPPAVSVAETPPVANGRAVFSPSN